MCAKGLAGGGSYLHEASRRHPPKRRSQPNDKKLPGSGALGKTPGKIGERRKSAGQQVTHENWEIKCANAKCNRNECRPERLPERRLAFGV
jgi:hypothetical protein